MSFTPDKMRDPSGVSCDITEKFLGHRPWQSRFYKVTGNPHDGRADKDSYPHDGHANKNPYRHNRHMQI